MILTSGTTGTPKGADRRQPATLDPIAGLLERIPLRARERTLISAPLFHSWGLTNLVIGIGLSSTIVLQRRFAPEQALRAIDEHGVTALVVVPVMLQRILECGPRVVRMHDTRLAARHRRERVGAAGRSRGAGDGCLRRRALQPLRLDRGGVGDDRDAGRPARGPGHRRQRAARNRRAPVRRRRRARSRPARAGASSSATSSPSTATPVVAARPIVDGLVSSGDVGRFDAAGRLFVEGREDEMIVSGGENVFPREVEDAIAMLAGVREVAAIGVPDADFGQRLRAFVVREDGATLTAEAGPRARAGEPRALQGPARRRVRRRAAAQRHRQGAQARPPRAREPELVAR